MNMLQGSFKSIAQVDQMELELVLHVEVEADETHITLDLPQQGIMGVAAVGIVNNKNEIAFELPTLQWKFNGNVILKDLVGQLEVNNQSIELTFTPTILSLPGNPALVTSDADLMQLINLEQGNFKYKVEDYFKRPNSSSFQLSPNGKYLSYREKDTFNKRHVYVKEIATGLVTQIVKEETELVRGYGWLNDQRLAYMMDQGGNENYHIYAVNVDGTNNIDLTPFDHVQAGILNMLKEQKDFMIITLNLDNEQVFEPISVR